MTTPLKKAATLAETLQLTTTMLERLEHDAERTTDYLMQSGDATADTQELLAICQDTRKHSREIRAEFQLVRRRCIRLEREIEARRHQK